MPEDPTPLPHIEPLPGAAAQSESSPELPNVIAAPDVTVAAGLGSGDASSDDSGPYLAEVKALHAEAAAKSKDIDDGHKYVSATRDAVKDEAKKVATLARAATRSAERAELFFEAAKTSATGASDCSRDASSALAEARSKVDEISAIATAALAAKTQIADSQAVIATKSDHIQKAQEHADSVRGALDRKLTETTQLVTTADGHKARCQVAADAAAQSLAGIRSSQAKAESETNAIVDARKEAEEAALATKGLADKTNTIERRLGDYEKRLSDLQIQCAAQLRTIESLLPGATSAGLAYAFDERRKTFKQPHQLWQWVYVVSVVLLVCLGTWGLVETYLHRSNPERTDPVFDYSQVLLMWLTRLPVAAALVWLALHASREAALAKRLEEDYGYKAAIASSFEGFRTQMAEIETEVTPDAPLGRLCGDTLSTIANPPGRIYERHKLIVTPASEIASAAKSVTQAASVVRSQL